MDHNHTDDHTDQIPSTTCVHVNNSSVSGTWMLRECGWSPVRLELQLLVCWFLGVAAGALQPFEGKHWELCLRAPLVLRAEPALCSLPGAARLWHPRSAGLAVPGCSCPACPAQPCLGAGAPRALTAGPRGALRGRPGTAMASGPLCGPLRASCLELNPQVGLSCCPASFGQCLSMLLVYHSPLACTNFLHAPCFLKFSSLTDSII